VPHTSKAKQTPSPPCPDKTILGGLFRTHGHCLHTVVRQFAKEGCTRDKEWKERRECCRCDVATRWKKPWWDWEV
jgi:hypothetical protein